MRKYKIKYQCPRIRPLNEAFPVFAVCISGSEAKSPTTCLSGVSASQSACSQGVHPEFDCSTGSLPGTGCNNGSGHGEW